MKKIKINVETTINAPIERVWYFYTSPEHITQWNFASDDWCCPGAENDMRVGGKYRARMEAKDGSSGFDFEAIYDEIIDQKAFTYTMSDGRKVAVEFESNNNITHAKVTFDAETENPVKMQREGWQAILNNFKKYVEGNE